MTIAALRTAEAAASWLLRQDAIQMHDPHSEALALHYASRAPRRAAAFANRIVLEARRERMQDRLRTTWQQFLRSANASMMTANA